MTGERWERMAALSGVVVGVLFVAIIALAGEQPKAPAQGTAVSSYFAQHRTELLIAMYLQGLAGVIMIWFWGAVRSALAAVEAGTGRLSSVVLVAGAGQAVLYILSSALLGVLAYDASQPQDATAAAVLYRVGLVTFQVGAFPLGAALLATSVVGLRDRALPAWFAWITGAFGVIALVLRAIPDETYGPEQIGSVAFFLVPLWFSAAGVLLMARSSTRRARTEAVPA